MKSMWDWLIVKESFIPKFIAVLSMLNQDMKSIDVSVSRCVGKMCQYTGSMTPVKNHFV